MTLTPTPTDPRDLPWNSDVSGLLCRSCPEHVIAPGPERHEIVLEGRGLDGKPDHHDALSVLR